MEDNQHRPPTSIARRAASGSDMTDEAKFGSPALTFDDVLLLPAPSQLLPSEADTSARLTRRILLRLPLLSSAMDTVTEATMAVAMARQGGVGVLHRNMSVEEQAHQVDIVKRSEAGMITNPVTCGPEATIAEVDELCARYRISGLPVISADDVLLGIITNRDIRFEQDHSRRAGELMTPMPLVTAPVGVSREQALLLLSAHKVEKLPLVDAQGLLRGLITVKDFTKSERFPSATKDAQGRLMAGAAVGVGADAKRRAQALIDVGVDFLVVDTAHGQAQAALTMVSPIKANPRVAGIGGEQYKLYRGMGSIGAMRNTERGRSYSKDRYFQDDVLREDKLVPQGVEGRVPYRGALSAVAGQLVGGLRAAMGFCGTLTIAELQEARFIQITGAGLAESHPHHIHMVTEAPNYSGPAG